MRIKRYRFAGITKLNLNDETITDTKGDGKRKNDQMGIRECGRAREQSGVCDLYFGIHRETEGSND